MVGHGFVVGVEQLAALGVPVMMPYSAENLAWSPDLVVVGPDVTMAVATEVAETYRLRRPFLGVVLMRRRMEISTMTEGVDMVRAEANNALCSFQECWPPLKREWRPATEVAMRAEFFTGRIVLSGKPDLTIGFADGHTAGKVIVDFKTGRTSADRKSVV